jgi:hypothetical protein
MGVGVAGGAESIVHAVRSFLAGLPAESALLKVDFENAFNRVSRSALLDEVATNFPTLLPYAWSAYGEETPLLFGPTKLQSAAGVQQGDPLGPLFFSLVLDRLVRDAPRISFRGWFLDDGAIGDNVDNIRTWVAHVRREGPTLGLHLSDRKCEWIAHTAAEFQHVPPSSATILGAHVGAQSGQQLFWDTLHTALSSKHKLLASFGLTCPHSAFTLLRMCGGASVTNYFARCMAMPREIADRFDKDTRSTAESIFAATLSEAQWEQVSLPGGSGGFGLRRLTDFSLIAHAASIIQFGLDPERFSLGLPRPPLAAIMALPTFPLTAKSILSESVEIPAHDKRNLQKKATTALTQERRERLLASTSEEHQARIVASSAEHATLWLIPPAVTLWHCIIPRDK